MLLKYSQKIEQSKIRKNLGYLQPQALARKINLIERRAYSSGVPEKGSLSFRR